MRSVLLTLSGLLASVWVWTGKKPTMGTDPYPFIENRGQVTDPTGRPLREVLFTFSGPNVRGYVTS